jgi:hypothetical protein
VSGPETWDSLELYWDLYLVSILFLVLGLLLILRRPTNLNVSSIEKRYLCSRCFTP